MLVPLIVLAAILYYVMTIIQTQNQSQNGGDGAEAICPFRKVTLVKHGDGLTLTAYQVGSSLSEPPRTFKNNEELAKFWTFLKLNNPGLSSCPYDYSNSASASASTEPVVELDVDVGFGASDNVNAGTDTGTELELEDRIDRNNTELERLGSSFQEIENRLESSIASSAEISTGLKDIARPPSDTTKGYSREHGQSPQEPCPIAYDTHSYFFLRA